MSFASIDAQIRQWVERHSFTLFTECAENECRVVYLSSAAGECFQIWIDPPVDGRARVNAACVEGRRDLEEPMRWRVAIADLDTALESAADAVVRWMAPSTRHYPSAAPLV